MKLAEFNDLCRREYENGAGIVTRLTLTGEECAELTADVIGSGVAVTLEPAGIEGTCGARLTQVTPVTEHGPGMPVPVAVGPASIAEVTRWVPVAL